MFMNCNKLKLLDLKFYFCAFCAFLRLYQYSTFNLFTVPAKRSFIRARPPAAKTTSLIENWTSDKYIREQI